MNYSSGPKLRADDVADLVGMGPSAFHQTEDSLLALAGSLVNFEDGKEGVEGGLSVTKSLVVQCFIRRGLN